jgi:hypothetical protein
MIDDHRKVAPEHAASRRGFLEAFAVTAGATPDPARKVR